MLDKKEFAHERDTNQFLLPYEKCGKEEKEIRRYIAIRLKFILESKSKSSN